MHYIKRVRLTPEQRKIQIVDAAVKVALQRGLYNVTLANVSRSIDDVQCSKSTIKHYFSMGELRYAVIHQAVLHYHVAIVAQAIIMEHPAVAGFTDGQRRKYLDNV